jgi:hypothetical protein
MPIQATLDDMSLPELFNILSMRGATGRVIVEHDQDRALLYFESGQLVFVTSPTIGQRLGEVLVEQASLSRENLQMALDWQRFMHDDAPTLGALLVEQRLITRAALEQALIRQAEQVLYQILVWTSGKVRFRAGQVSTTATPLPHLNLEQLILEAVRRADERAWQGHVRRSDAPAAPAREVALSAS